MPFFLNLLVARGKIPRTMIQYGTQTTLEKCLVEMYQWSVLNLKVLNGFSSLLGLLRRVQFIPF